MRFVVYGAGAVGGVLGARLFAGGHDVVLVARGAHHDAIRARGLRVDDPGGSQTLRVPVVDHPRRLSLGPDDVVVLTMKSQDTTPALEALAGAEVAVACAQNGVENERAALRRFERVYAVCVMCPAGHLEPGVVHAYSGPVTGLLDLGRYPEGLDETAEAVAAAFRASTYDSVVRPDVMRWKHTKLLMNLGNAVEALCGPGARRGPFTERVRAEGEACLQAAGIDYASAAEDADRRGDLLRVRPVPGGERLGSSTLQSLARGTGSLETDYLNGEIVLLGRRLGVPTPANALAQRLAGELARGRLAPGSTDQEALLALLG